MSILIKIIGVCVITAFLSALLRKNHPEYAFLLIVCASSVMLAYLFNSFKTVFEGITGLMNLSGINSAYGELILKIMGIACLSEYISALFYDANETAMGKKIELAGKLVILLISLPVIKRLSELILTIN